jgi:hypothetical protein
MNDVKAVGAIVTGAASLGFAPIPVATVVSSAPGILGALGLTVTTTVTLPVAGVVAAGGLLGYGIYKGMQAAQSK